MAGFGGVAPEKALNSWRQATGLAAGFGAWTPKKHSTSPFTETSVRDVSVDASPRIIGHATPAGLLKIIADNPQQLRIALDSVEEGLNFGVAEFT